VASLLAPFLIGMMLGDLLHGVPVGANHEFTGHFWNLLQPYGILVGVTMVSLCLLHGATFIALKTTGVIRDRARRLARLVAPATALLVLAFISWTHVTAGGGAFLNPVELLACLAVLAAWAVIGGHEGWAFAATTVAIAVSIITIFVDLYPRVMVSSINPAYSLTVRNSASTPYSLKVMTVVALVFLPIVLAYQAWTYYVFRRRVSDMSYRPAAPRPAVPVAVATAAQPAASAGDARASRRTAGAARRRRLRPWTRRRE
jgi:cytochrome d ubiquinol oxidase subunit II